MNLSQPTVFVRFFTGGSRYQKGRRSPAKGKHYREYSDYRGAYEESGHPGSKVIERRAIRRIANHNLRTACVED